MQLKSCIWVVSIRTAGLLTHFIGNTRKNVNLLKGYSGFYRNITFVNAYIVCGEVNNDDEFSKPLYQRNA